MTFLQRTIHYLGQSIGSLLKVFKWHPKKQKLNPTLLEESSKTLPKTPSQDSVSESNAFKEEALIYYDIVDSYAAYREAAKSDAFLFGDYDGYQAFEDLDKEG